MSIRSRQPRGDEERGESPMIAGPNQRRRDKLPPEDTEQDDEHWRREAALDEALANTFPASDPVSAEQPVPDY